jgi:hypothetical protein
MSTVLRITASPYAPGAVCSWGGWVISSPDSALLRSRSKIKSPASMSRATQLTIPSLAMPALFLLWQCPHHNGIAAPNLSSTRQRARRTRGKPSVLKRQRRRRCAGARQPWPAKNLRPPSQSGSFFPGPEALCGLDVSDAGEQRGPGPLPRFKLTEMQPAKSGPGVSPRQSRHPWRACFRPGVWGLRPKAKH